MLPAPVRDLRMPVVGAQQSIPTRGPPEAATFSGRAPPALRIPRTARLRSARKPSAVHAGPSNAPEPLDVDVQQLRTYVEGDGFASAANGTGPQEDWEGGIADLVPGGRPSERPNQSGASRMQSQAASSAPLRVAMDLRLYRARQDRIAAQRLADGDAKRSLQATSEGAFLAARALDPFDLRTYVSLATLYVRQRRNEDARRVLEEGCAVSQGTNAYVWTTLANLERLEGKYAAARTCYDAALVADSRHAAAYHGWAMLERGAGNYVAARDVLVRGISATRDSPSPYLLDAIGNLAAAVGLLDEAREWFRAGTNTAMGAQSHAIYTSWACLEWKQGDLKIAPYLFQMALRQQPRNRFALLSYAMMEKENNNLDACRQLLQRALEGNPTDPALFQAYAIVCAEEGNLEEARKTFQRGVDVDRRHQSLWQAWGIMEWRAGNVPIARKLFQKGVWADPLSPDNVFLWQSWAVMEGKLGNAVQARTLFKAALKVDPASEAVWQAWIQMEEAEGLYESADLLRNYRMAALNRAALPDGFSTLISPEAPPNPVLRTVREWTRRFDRSLDPVSDSASKDSVLVKASKDAP